MGDRNHPSPDRAHYLGLAGGRAKGMDRHLIGSTRLCYPHRLQLASQRDSECRPSTYRCGTPSGAGILVAVSGCRRPHGLAGCHKCSGYGRVCHRNLSGTWIPACFFRKIVPENLVTGKREESWRQQIWKYSWPFTAWGVFSWAQQVSDRWALQVCARATIRRCVNSIDGEYPSGLL